MDTSTSTPAVIHPAPPSWRLTDEDAWDIAMAWQTALQGRVRLLTDRDGPANSIIQSYAWVRIDASGAVARAAMITWTALAACPGFSATENAAFWKRVFSDLQEHRGPPHQFHAGPNGHRDKPVAITDAIGFFDQPGHRFPRFMGAAAHAWRVQFGGMFLGEESSGEANAQVAATLETLLARLEPFRRHYGTRQIDLCVRMRPQFDDGAVRAVTTAEREINTLSARMLGAAVRFQITHVMLEDEFNLSGEEQPLAFLRFAQQIPVRFRPLTLFPHLNNASRETRAQWLRGFLRLEGHGVLAQVSSFSFPRPYFSDTVFQTLMATLPFANSVHSISFTAERATSAGDFEHVDLPWIAYAIFHPRAATSSWRYLTLESLTITDQSRHVITAMKRGNNLLALLKGTPPTSDAYYSAQLQAGATVCGSPTDSRDVVFSASSATLVDVCGISSLEAATWDEWVAVIIPAYGLGYVRSHDIFDLCAHAPCSKQSLGLRLIRKHNYGGQRATNDPPEVLLRVLSPLGAVVTSLHVASYLDMSRSTVHEVLCACLSLKTLVVSHTGKFWSHPIDDAYIVPRQLEELELNVDAHPRVAYPRVDYLQNSMSNLRALRICMQDTHIDSLTASRETFTKLLAQLPSLEYFHRRTCDSDNPWSDQFPIPYTKSAKWTERALGQLWLNTPAIVNSRLGRGAYVAAFISVIDHKRLSDPAIARAADHDLVTTIFQYIDNQRARWIHIEPDNKREFEYGRSHYASYAATVPNQTASSQKRGCTVS